MKTRCFRWIGIAALALAAIQPAFADTHWAVSGIFTLDTKILSAPTGLIASDGTYQNFVRLYWSAASNAAGYQVWRNTTASTGTAVRIGTTTTMLCYDDSTAGRRTTYYYWGKATNDLHVSGFSASDSGCARGGQAAGCSTNNCSDRAVFDINNGYWYIRGMNGTVVTWATCWGWPDANPVAGDYDGDGKSDLAIFDQNTGKWYITTVSGTTLAWGKAWGWSGAEPVSGAAW